MLTPATLTPRAIVRCGPADGASATAAERTRTNASTARFQSAMRTNEAAARFTSSNSTPGVSEFHEFRIVLVFAPARELRWAT